MIGVWGIGVGSTHMATLSCLGIIGPLLLSRPQTPDPRLPPPLPDCCCCFSSPCLGMLLQVPWSGGPSPAGYGARPLSAWWVRRGEGQGSLGGTSTICLVGA